MKLNWYKFVFKRKHDSQQIFDDFNSIFLHNFPLMQGNSLLESSDVYAIIDDEQIYYCSVNINSFPLAQIFLDKYSVSPCQKPNLEDVSHLWGDKRSFFY